MSVLDELARVTRPGSDDDTVIPEPGLDAATIDAVERRIGAPLPTDLRTLLGACHGIRGLEWEIDFTGTLAFEMAELFPHGLPIVGDHTANFWVVDCTAAPGMGFAWGRCGYPAGLRRFGEERLFACAAPQRRTGLLSRLFGR
jgi:hypothetical protein